MDSDLDDSIVSIESDKSGLRSKPKQKSSQQKFILMASGEEQKIDNIEEVHSELEQSARSGGFGRV